MTTFVEWYNELTKQGNKRSQAIAETLGEKPEVEVWLAEAYKAGQNKINLEDKSSICEWELSFTFKNRQQCTKALEYIQQDEILFGYMLNIHEDDRGNMNYTVVIPKGSWANNLVSIAKILEKVDFEL